MNKRIFSWITFDCYGTLIDWETGILETIAPLLERSGLELESLSVLRAYGKLESRFEREYRPYREVLCLVLKGLRERLGFDLQPGEEELLVKSLPEWPPFPEVNFILRELKNRGFRLGIISNIDRDLMAETLKHFVVDFDLVLTAEEARTYKPDPKIFELAFERIGEPRERILHVGQSLFHDIAPARKLGLKTCWVKRPGRDPYGATPPTEVETDLVVSDLSGLLALPL
ncbi:haloacid dehalogenase type II [Thermosulfurimonas dismutans]|uniref:2-haloalkanoic acid dehalogenase n=1 Tax=Thermosulfurimonas dismutans TaxID=999894 RepID=A0A179D539_9BACT|nr:haloacid dehalogenase type II [Thermosulfurimonas dismutans]OAQ21214.1 2-haloalkanoic acid dehalogenase [Thermosulfurimonas dismutans]